MSEVRVERDAACLLVVDVQERLSAVMPEGPMAQLSKNTGILLEAARRMGMPVVVSEQYPKGLGPTIAPVASALNDIDDLARIEKVDFSVCAAEGFAAEHERLRSAGRTQWIVLGMEAHICVFQTVRALRGLGDAVHVPVDAVVSRAKHNYQTGLRLAERCGAYLSSTEILVMDLLGRAQGEDFKAISKLIR